MSKLIVKLNADYSGHKAGEEVAFPYGEASSLVNSGLAKVVRFEDEKVAKEGKTSATRKTKEEKTAKEEKTPN